MEGPSWSADFPCNASPQTTPLKPVPLIVHYNFCHPNTNEYLKCLWAKNTEKLRTVEDQNVSGINGYIRGQKFTLSYAHVPLQHFFYFLSLVANKTNHHSVSRGGLNVTAPSHKKTAAQISMREMKSSQGKKKRGHTEAPVSVEISANLLPFTLFVRKIRSECKPATKGLCLKSVEEDEGA